MLHHVTEEVHTSFPLEREFKYIRLIWTFDILVYTFAATVTAWSSIKGNVFPPPKMQLSYV